ncbi:MAG: DMT family transporter [Trueperaceae bacterium]
MREVPRLASTWIALGYVSAVGSVVVFLLYVRVVQHWTASRASYVMVLVPFVAVALSAWLDQEPITSGLVFGGALVLGGVYFGAPRPSEVVRPARPEPAR